MTMRIFVYRCKMAWRVLRGDLIASEPQPHIYMMPNAGTASTSTSIFSWTSVPR